MLVCVYLILFIGLLNPCCFAVNKKSLDLTIEQCWKLRYKNSKQAINYCNQSLGEVRIGKKNNDWSKLLNYTGVVHLYLGNIDSAYIYFQNALQKATDFNNSIEIAYAYNNIADYYFESSNYLLATENILKSYKIFKEQNDSTGIAYNLTDLSELYVKQNKLETALDTLKSALKIRESTKKFKKAVLTKRRIISIYLLKNEIDSAEMIANEIFSEDAIKNPVARANYYDVLSEIYYNRKAFNDALEFRLKSIESNQKLNIKKDEAIGLYKLGEIYLSVNNFLNAEKAILQSQKIAKSIGQKEIELKNYFLLSKVYNANKDFENAYFFLKKYNQLNDSINTKISENSILNLEQAYSQKKNESEKKMLQEKVKYDERINYYLKLFLGSLSLLFIYLAYEILSKRIANGRLKASNYAKDRFFSILSHDIKSPVSNIKTIADLLNTNSEKIADSQRNSLVENLKYSVENLIILIDRLIEWSKATTGRTQYSPVNFNINKEIENVLSLNKDSAYAKNQNLIYKEIEEHLVYADKEMVNTVLRNLLTNAIKFTPKNGFIQFSLTKKSNSILVLIEDTGIGMTKETIDEIINNSNINSRIGTSKEKGTGIGLLLCKELIKINKGKFWIESKLNKGSKFYFSLPAN